MLLLRLLLIGYLEKLAAHYFNQKDVIQRALSPRGRDSDSVVGISEFVVSQFHTVSVSHLCVCKDLVSSITYLLLNRSFYCNLLFECLYDKKK